MAKLLFIDDDPEIRRLFVPFLRERSHTVTACENGLQAMLLLQKDFHFDVIICDYCMPIKTGGEVWNLVRKLYPAIPFVLFTSQILADLPEFDDTFQYSGNVWLRKPASPGKLLKVVHSLLSEEAASSFMS